jgi:Calcineurin-like phosphoesterase
MKFLPATFAFLCLLLAGTAHAETWRFALIGDAPYSDYERRELPLMLGEIAEQHPAFVVHAGDFKGGSTTCSDALFLDRFALFNASAIPFIYVPGDNEWTDCSRVSAGGFDQVERLNKLRKVFFADDRSLGQSKLQVEHQSATYPEHLRWQFGPVLFVTLNVPGPDNNYGNGREPSAEFLARNPAVIDWLKQGFAVARREKSAGIVIVMQADPDFKHFAAGLTHRGYRALLETLRQETLAFPGQVLLVHGDTHMQRIDQPLRHPETKLPIANFTRAETFGYPFMGWTKGIIDSDDARLFRFEVHPYKAH